MEWEMLLPWILMSFVAFESLLPLEFLSLWILKFNWMGHKWSKQLPRKQTEMKFIYPLILAVSAEVLDFEKYNLETGEITRVRRDSSDFQYENHRHRAHFDFYFKSLYFR